MNTVKEILNEREIRFYSEEYNFDQYEFGNQNFSVNEKLFLGCCYIMGYQGEYDEEQHVNLRKELGIKSHQIIEFGDCMIRQGLSDS